MGTRGNANQRYIFQHATQVNVQHSRTKHRSELQYLTHVASTIFTRTTQENNSQTFALAGPAQAYTMILTSFAHHFLRVAEGLEDNRLSSHRFNFRVDQNENKDGQEVVRAEIVRVVAGVFRLVQYRNGVRYRHERVELDEKMTLHITEVKRGQCNKRGQSGAFQG